MNTLQKVLPHMWSNSAGVLSRKDKPVERHNGAGNNSLKRFALTAQVKRSDKAPQSTRYKNTNTRSINPEMHSKRTKVEQTDGMKTRNHGKLRQSWKCTSENPTKRRRSTGRHNLGTSGMLFKSQLEDPTRCQRVNILILDTLTALE